LRSESFSHVCAAAGFELRLRVATNTAAEKTTESMRGVIR